MPGVILEIDEEDIFAPVREKLEQIERIRVPRSSVCRDREEFPDPPIRDESMSDVEHDLSIEELTRLANESNSAQLEALEVFPVIVEYLEGCEGQCLICLQPLMRICMKCDSRETNFEECAVSIALCGHAIHQHCYETYKNSFSGASTCLICRRDWILAASYNLSTEERIK